MMQQRSWFVALVLLVGCASLVPVVDATTVVTTGHYYGWSLSSMSTTALLLSLPLLLLLVTLFFQSFVFLSQLAGPGDDKKKKDDDDDNNGGNVNNNDRQFFRYMAIFWLSVTLLMYLWLLIALSTFPTYYGFGGMGTNWGFMLFFNLVIFAGMVWYLVYLINKARHQRVNPGGSSCWRRGGGGGGRRRNNDNRSASESE